MYNGVPTASTAVDSPFYHTTADTPDKVDDVALASAVDDFDTSLTLLMKNEPAAFSGLDDKLWQASLTLEPSAASAPLIVHAQIADAQGRAQAATAVNAVLLVDDFFPAASLDVTTDGNGLATFSFTAAERAMGTGNRFVHVSAGPEYPLVEQIIQLP